MIFDQFVNVSEVSAQVVIKDHMIFFILFLIIKKIKKGKKRKHLDDIIYIMCIYISVHVMDVGFKQNSMFGSTNHT